MTVTIDVNENEACATYGIINDGNFEGPETFNVALESSDLPVDPLFSNSVVTITDDGTYYHDTSTMDACS